MLGDTNMRQPYTKEQIQALLSKVRATIPNSSNTTAVGKHGEAITYNAEQQEFINLVASGKSCILIGAAGTGKTTCTRGAIQALIESNRIPILSQGIVHKHLVAGTPGIVATSFTRRAVSNIKQALDSSLRSNCITTHKLLEYEPVFYTTEDPETGDEKRTMRFEPSRNRYNPLPSEIRCVFIDEASMMGLDLYENFTNALASNIQIVFVGDINQLPPIFGPAILGFKMLELPIVELKQVYRQALESPIIKLATEIKEGKTLVTTEKLQQTTERGTVIIHPWKKKLKAEIALQTASKFMCNMLDAGSYSPENDIILCPFNKAFGTIELNKSIANHIARKEQRVTWEIITGFGTLYLSVGDKVLYDKEDAIVTKIVRNGSYLGKAAQQESTTLDYWGYNSAGAAKHAAHISEGEEGTDELLNLMLDNIASIEDKEARVRAASHIVTLQMLDSEKEIELDSAAELNSMILGYALTVHKAQGSEWDRVFLLLHQSHNTMIQRELLYTAVTRAATSLYVICESDTFEKGVLSQRITGNTLAEKAQYFMGKVTEGFTLK